MSNTLGLDDDLDSVEVVISLEKAFAVNISDDEASSCNTVGDHCAGCTPASNSDQIPRWRSARAGTPELFSIAFEAIAGSSFHGRKGDGLAGQAGS